jgi:RES domain-containing protein
VRAVYCSIDPAAAILEVAVHKGIRALDTVPHVLTSATVTDPSRIHVVVPEDVPNPNWLRSGILSGGQQEFGDALLKQYGLVLIPSSVSIHSLNLVLTGGTPNAGFVLRSQERFALDTRLHPPARS